MPPLFHTAIYSQPTAHTFRKLLLVESSEPKSGRLHKSTLLQYGITEAINNACLASIWLHLFLAWPVPQLYAKLDPVKHNRGAMTEI
jgi:hypothetical protein